MCDYGLSMKKKIVQFNNVVIRYYSGKSYKFGWRFIGQLPK